VLKGKNRHRPRRRGRHKDRGRRGIRAAFRRGIVRLGLVGAGVGAGLEEERGVRGALAVPRGRGRERMAIALL
jgi:hypothetical protein